MAGPEPRLRDIFSQALQCQTAEEQAAYLDQACQAEAGLRVRLDELLRAHREAGSFLQEPSAAPAATVDERPVGERLGTVIGPYKLLQQIGEGGMGTVFMAEQTHPVKRKVALKIIKAGMDSRQVIARFEAERQALAMMDHVNIARVFDGGATEAGLPYFVMELVHGVPITKYCDDNHLTPRERLELYVPVCQAIQHAHQKGIIHRDIKPSNVMVTLYDGRPVPKVIDFGVAKATEQKLTDRTLFTQYGTMVGTLEYMSPEQAETSALGVDTRSDIYSLGVLLYELLTGNTPLTHRRMKEAAHAEILRMIKEEEPPRPSTRLSDSGEALASISANRHMEPAKLTKLVRGELDWIVMKTLEKDRNRRYETANGFVADVQRYLNDEPVEACPPSRWYRFRKYARKYKKTLATAVAFAALLVAATISSIGLASWALRERNNAERQKQSAEANFRRAVDAVDQMLTRVGEERLTNVPQMEPVRRDLLQDALRFYQEFLRERGDGPAVRSEAARAYRRVGQVQVLLGQRDEGEAAYQQAVTLLEKLLDESPGDPSLLNELGETHNALGLVYHSLDRWPQAEAAFQRGVALLAQREPENPLPLKNRHTLAGIYSHLVVLYRQTGDLDKAEAAFVKCKALSEDLLAGDPRDVKALTLLAACHGNVGLVYGAKGSTREAEAAYQKAVELYQQLSRRDPEVVSLQKSLAQAHNNLGLLYAQTRQSDEAGVHYRQSLALNKAVFDDHPRVAAFRVELGGSYSNMAAHVRRTRSAEASLEWTARAIDTLGPALEQDARSLTARFFLFDALMGRGYALVGLGRREDAARDWRQMLELSEGQPDIRMRLYRPLALAFLGEHARATAEIETLVTEGHTQGRNPLLFAKVHSLSSAAAADARLPPAEQEQLADRYGGRAVELLRKAQAAGFFQDPGQLPQLKESKDFNAIRSRPDFQRLLAELEKASEKKPPPK